MAVTVTSKPHTRRRVAQPFILSFLILCLLLLLSCALTPASARTPVTSGGASLCPRCPLCDRPRTSTFDRLRYCQGFTSYAFALLSRGKSERAAASQRSDASHHRTQRHRYPRELPFATDDAVRAGCMRDVRDLLVSRVRGQPQVVTPLLEVLRRKLAYPREPVVVHLAGDNGVGKTHTARLVSQALSLRCAADRDVCDAGDNLLTIAGTGFDGMSVAEARARIVGQVMEHVRHYPHGVVLVDDLTAMEPALVSALAPLFGRASYFAEQLAEAPAAANSTRSSGNTKHWLPWSWGTSSGAGAAAAAAAARAPPLSQLLVFITTDFGRQGRTVGKSRADIEAMVQQDFAALYGTLLPAYTRTFVFFPFTTAMAEEVVRSVVTDLPCALGEHLIASSWISDAAVAFLVEQHRLTWAGRENGHALRRLVEDELISQLIVYWEEHAVQERLLVRFELDERQLQVVLRLPVSGAVSVMDVAAANAVAESDLPRGASDEGDL